MPCVHLLAKTVDDSLHSALRTIRFANVCFTYGSRSRFHGDDEEKSRDNKGEGFLVVLISFIFLIPLPLQMLTKC